MSLGGFDGVELVVADFREVGATLFYCNKCGGHCKVYYNPRKGLEVCGRASRSRCANTSSLVPHP